MDTVARMRGLRFLAVGALNTAFGFSVYAILLRSGVPYPVAVGVATVLGILFNFRSLGGLVFNDTRARRLPAFIAVYATLYAINVLGIGLIVDVGLSALVAGIVVMLPVAVLGYVLNSRFVYRSEPV